VGLLQTRPELREVCAEKCDVQCACVKIVFISHSPVQVEMFNHVMYSSTHEVLCRIVFMPPRSMPNATVQRLFCTESVVAIQRDKITLDYFLTFVADMLACSIMSLSSTPELEDFNA
jgi:hypothetical protein